VHNLESKENKMNLGYLVKGVLRGYSILRIYQNYEISKIVVSGYGIDLGAKSLDAKYYSSMNFVGVYHLDFADYYNNGVGIIKVDLEKPLNIDSNTYDFVILFNVAEHIYNFQLLISEVSRILRPEGRFYIMTPFLYHYHPDPHDYFRYTHELLRKVLHDSGFDIELIKSTGQGRLLVAGELIFGVISVRILRLIGFVSFAAANYILGKFIDPQSFALGYLAVARKRSN
jgi:SAM-dependent methyltransferase